MDTTALAGLSETARMLLGAFALADVHTLSAADVAEMSSNVISADKASDALNELAEAGLAEALQADEVIAYRLTKVGLEISLELQSALAQRSQQQ